MQRPAVTRRVWFEDRAVRSCWLVSVVGVGRCGWSAYRGISSRLAETAVVAANTEASKGC